jgi:glutamyl-tRNA synthetase
MENFDLAKEAFPALELSLEECEKRFPLRNLEKGAAVARLAPSPTGFIHLGNLYVAMADEALARQSGGVFLLRIEDTDDKREVKGAVESLVSSLSSFGVQFSEGAASAPQGDYGPYRQSERAPIYQAAAKRLMERGLAYPCFCSEEDLSAQREEQAKLKANFGYYGPWAKCRRLTAGEGAERIRAGEKFTVRLRSQGKEGELFTLEDAIRGTVSMPQNTNDVVLLKTNGIPTYHFAHVVDDHFMRVTHVLRGEEWLSSLPVHVELFGLMGWETPLFCHTALLMKMDNGAKRKLSKRKDPELGLEYYQKQGYHPLAVREYLMTLLNSNFEEWRAQNQEKALEEFPFSIGRLGSSGALVDLGKLNDVSKDALARLSPESVASFLSEWAKGNRADLLPEYQDTAYLERIASIGRGEKNPRKDFSYGEQIAEYIAFFFDRTFRIEDGLPGAMGAEEANALLDGYLAGYSHADGKDAWFEKVRSLAQKAGYAARPKDYKKEPEKFKGHVGDVSALIRLALSGRLNAPDIWEMQQAMGEERARKRLENFHFAYQGRLGGS